MKEPTRKLRLISMLRTDTNNIQYTNRQRRKQIRIIDCVDMKHTHMHIHCTCTACRKLMKNASQPANSVLGILAQSTDKPIDFDVYNSTATNPYLPVFSASNTISSSAQQAAPTSSSAQQLTPTSLARQQKLANHHHSSCQSYLPPLSACKHKRSADCQRQNLQTARIFTVLFVRTRFQ